MTDTPIVVATNYALQLEVHELKNIEHKDDIAHSREGQARRQKSLLDLLTEVPGVRQVDYNGHFGPYILYLVRKEDDKPAIHAKVRTVVRRYLRIRHAQL